MKKGIKFQVPNEWEMVIYNILQGIDFKKYIWKINNDEVYTEDYSKNNGFLFPQEKEAFSTEEFIKIISQLPYYTVFVNIQAYLNEKDFAEIENYKQFNESKCELIIFVTDNIFVNIYAKSESIIEKIKENALLNRYEKIEYITDENI